MKKYECRIVTFQRAVNYGAVLQAYALKRVMSNYCYTTVLDHINISIKNFYSSNPFKQASLKGGIVRAARFIPNIIRNQRFNKFINKYVINDKPIIDKAFYITGSDQVWNYDCSDFDKTYFLDFVKDNSLKNSYSASFGFDAIPTKYVQDYKKLLENYNLISVRESKGAEIVKDLLDIDVPVTLDPTLLLTKEQWADIFCMNKIGKKYILVYAFSVSDNMRDFINKLSAQKNLPVIILKPEKSLSKNYGINRAVYKTLVSPEEWVNYFYNASYIVTNSFHGTAFSINFNKNFFVEFLPESAGTNSRLSNILYSLNLENRIINSNMDVDICTDFSEVNKKLMLKREESMEFLKTIVKSYNE